MDIKKTGQIIKEAREKHDLTQKELAGRLHISDRTVSKWERGAGFPDVAILIRLADELNITVSELLHGELNMTRDTETEEFRHDEKAELTIREAVNTIYQQTAAKAKRNRMRIIAAVLIFAVIFSSVGFVLKKIGETRIIFAPKIYFEILQNQMEDGITKEVFIDRTDRGVYDYTIRCEIDQYGAVRFIDRSMWQSYADSVPSEVYKKLKKLNEGKLTSIWILDNGYLAEYYGEGNEPMAWIETDEDCNPVFILDSSVLSVTTSSATFINEDYIYVLSRHSDKDRMNIFSVNKNDRTVFSSSFSYEELSGEYNPDKRVGGFIFDGRNMWVKDDVLYFAETYYSGGTAAVMAAYNLRTGESEVFREYEECQIVKVLQNHEKGRVMVLMNPMDYQPLQLYELDAVTMEILSIKELALPPEYLTNESSYNSGPYLYEADISDDYILIKLPDVLSRSLLENEKRALIFAVYDRHTGEIIWKARMVMDAEFDTYDVNLKAAEY